MRVLCVYQWTCTAGEMSSFLFGFLKMMKTCSIAALYIYNVNIYRPNIWKTMGFFFFCACLKTWLGGGGWGGGFSTKTRICKQKKKKCRVYHESRLNKKRSNLHCTYFIPLLCAFLFTVHAGCHRPASRSVTLLCFLHFVWNPACLTWVQRVLYDNVRLCRSSLA